MATHSEARQFYRAVQAAKGLPERAKLPPVRKNARAITGMAAGAGAAEALGSVLGIETAHQRALKAQAEAMGQWRRKGRDLRLQDAEAWQQLKA